MDYHPVVIFLDKESKYVFSRFIASVLLLSAVIHAQPLTLSDAVAQFGDHNPDLAIARQEADKAHSEVTAARRRPNPVLSGSYTYVDVKHRFRDVSPSAAALATVHVDYPIETAHKRRHRIEAAQAGSDYANALFSETRYEQLSELIDAYFQVQADQADLSNAIENKRDFDTLLSVAESKYHHGFLSEIDIDKLRLQTIGYSREIEHARAMLSADTEALAYLLAMKASDIALPAPSKESDFPMMPLEDLIRHAQSSRPDCVAAERYVAFARSSLTLEQANAHPDITLGIETENYAPTYNGPLMGISFSYPLPVYDANEGAIEKERINVLQSVTIVSRTREKAASDVRQLYALYDAQKTIHFSAQRGYEAAKNLKERYEKVFALKGTSILELLDARRSYLEFQKNALHTLIDAQQAYARLKLGAGMEL